MELARKMKMIDDCIKRKANADLEQMDLTIAQHHALVFLVMQADHTAELKELEREFRVSQPTVAGIAQRLEAKGYVEAIPHPTDKRVKMLRLTEQGEGICRRSWEKMKERGERMTAGLSQEDLNELDRLLDVVYNNLESGD